MEWTKEDIVVKADSEGGWCGFLMWGGIGEDDVPIDIRAKWVEVLDAWKDFQRALDDLERDLPTL